MKRETLDIGMLNTEKNSRGKFMSADFMLTTETARHLFHTYGEKEPIIDYHCHLNPQEIYEDKGYENITQLWLYGDHYKWRLMRANAVEEQYITGNASDREKFQKWAETLPKAIGNPLYHWSHLELKKYFGYEGCLNGDTAEEVWQLCNKKLAKGLSARSLIQQSRVEMICTTDDPIDSLIWHKKLKEEEYGVKVLPTFRPDLAINPKKPEYLSYLKKLEKASGVNIVHFSDLMEALINRMDYFASQGCILSDHGMEQVVYEPWNRETVEHIFDNIKSEQPLTDVQYRQFQTACMELLGREYAKRNWVMQLHFGVARNLNQQMYEKLGADVGNDALYGGFGVGALGQYLSALTAQQALPKTILYSLNPNDNVLIETVMGCFQDASARGKLQHGAAWWFNDHKSGIRQHLTDLASQGLLGNFVGMLTDSRSFLSYARHDYFRRILCDIIGSWVEAGEYPAEEEQLAELIKDLSFANAQRYFTQS